MDQYKVTERIACSWMGLSRATYRYTPLPNDVQAPFKAELVKLASSYGRYGCRLIADIMRNSGWGQAMTPRSVVFGGKKV